MMTLGSWKDYPCKIHPNKPSGEGYVTVKVQGKQVLAHRAALEKKLGRAIKDGFEACHHCNVKNCVEPEHLWEGTHRDNIYQAHSDGLVRSWNARKAHCPRGHEFTKENTYIHRGSRSCKICRKAALRKRRE